MSTIALFHADNDAVFRIELLRAKATAVVTSSPLIRQCLAGSRRAAIALHVGYWPFVSDFPHTINKKANAQHMPREPLYAKFGTGTTKQVLYASARQLRALDKSEVDGVRDALEGAVQEMKKEERDHAAHWRADAAQLGLSPQKLSIYPTVPGVQKLIDSTYTDDLVEFFAILAGTELIAEELGRLLAPHPSAFTNQFRRKRWIWGEVHTIPHDDGPSHLDIDLDLARAYSAEDNRERIEATVTRTIELFGAAATDVERRFCAIAP